VLYILKCRCKVFLVFFKIFFLTTILFSSSNLFAKESSKSFSFDSFKKDFLVASKKKLFKYDKKRYIEILKIVNKMFDPVVFKAKSKGGQKRVNAGAFILNELIKIHKNYEYCSIQKTVKLNELLQKAKEKLSKLEGYTLKDNSKFIRYRGKLAEEVASLTVDVKNGVRIVKSIGANTSLGFLATMGVGCSLGKAVTPYGSGKFCIVGHDSISLGLPGIMGGVYNFECRGHGNILFVDVERDLDRKKKKVFPGNSYLFFVKEVSDDYKPGDGNYQAFVDDNEKNAKEKDYKELFGENSNYTCNGKHKIIEGGISVNLYTKYFNFQSTEVFFLKPDYDKFLKRLNIDFDSGLLPKNLVSQVENSCSKEEIKSINLKVYK